MQRYEWERPGDLIHLDVKSLARFRKAGHRITGNRQQGRSYGVGYDKVHVAVDDATRLAYVEVLADEQKPTVIGFLSRAVAWFNAQGVECRRVMSDNGPAYVSRAFAKACRISGSGTSAPGPTRPEPTARRSDMASGRLRLHSDPPPGVGLRHGLPELRGTEPLAALLPGAHLSSGSSSCSADEPGEKQQLVLARVDFSIVHTIKPGFSEST
ncbi:MULTISPECIES: DDE-type integrase/transposase/recombinase [Aphanothece]|uniref:DDE-type integrase/transposase/recombinase n=1 Tax=Aphanothece TaxID=1121 RepID=UPI0039846938